MKNYHKGFTLIELIIVVAIIGIMATVIGVFVGTGSNSFNSLSKNAKTQIELQETLDQIGEILIDTSNCINVTKDSVGQVQKLETFSYIESVPGEFSPDGKTFKAQKKVDTIEYDKSNQKVTWKRQRSYVYEGTEADTGFAPDATEASVLSEEVTDFKIDVSKIATQGIVHYTMTVEERGHSVQLEESVRVRNKVLVNKEGYDFSDVTDEPQDPDDPGPALGEIIIEIVGAPEQLDKGEVQLKYELSQEVKNPNVTWEIIENTQNSKKCTITSDGLLNVQGDHGLITIKVTFWGNESYKSCFDTVQIVIKKGPNEK